MAYAGGVPRFVAMLIDTLVMGVLAWPLGILVGMVSIAAGIPLSDWAIQLIWFLFCWLYYAGLESSVKQATLGKRVMGIKVTSLDGNRVGFGRATGRYFGKIISAIPLLIGYLIVDYTKKKQALHDMMAGCLVMQQA